MFFIPYLRGKSQFPAQGGTYSRKGSMIDSRRRATCRGTPTRGMRLDEINIPKDVHRGSKQAAISGPSRILATPLSRPTPHTFGTRCMQHVLLQSSAGAAGHANGTTARRRRRSSHTASSDLTIHPSLIGPAQPTTTRVTSRRSGVEKKERP